MTLLICRTCPRYDNRATGNFGRELVHAIATITDRDPGRAVPIRNPFRADRCTRSRNAAGGRSETALWLRSAAAAVR